MNRKDYYESIAENRNIWNTDKKSNLYYQERIRFDQILKLIPKHETAARILDFGCGNGYLSSLIANRTPNLVSLELSRHRLELFQAIAREKGISLLMGDVTQTGLKTDSFDWVVNSEVLEHLPEYKKAIGEVFRLLKPGGRFIVTVPNHEPLVVYTCPHCLQKIYPNHHINQFDADRLAADLREAGFLVEKSVVFRSKILNQFQYHFHLKYNFLLRGMDKMFSFIFPKYTSYLLVLARKPKS